LPSLYRYSIKYYHHDEFLARRYKKNKFDQLYLIFAAPALINASEGKSMQTKISMSDALSDSIEWLHAAPEPTAKMDSVM